MKLQLFSAFLLLPLLSVGAALHGGAHGARLASVGTLATHVCVMGPLGASDVDHPVLNVHIAERRRLLGSVRVGTTSSRVLRLRCVSA